MEEAINTCEIIWPYRFDLLVRIDFLDWFEAIGRKHLARTEGRGIISTPLISNAGFFLGAKQHPYFIQYTKLKRGYRLVNLTYDNAERIYAEGIANFIKLHQAIKIQSYDLSKKISLKKPLLKIKSSSRVGISRNNYIGDGCHRFACLLWTRKDFSIPIKFFRFRYRLIYRPEDSDLTAGYKTLGILRDQDIAYFDKLFGGSNTAIWEPAFQRVREIRERFSRMNIKDMFEIKFRGLDFRF